MPDPTLDQLLSQYNAQSDDPRMRIPYGTGNATLSDLPRASDRQPSHANAIAGVLDHYLMGMPAAVAGLNPFGPGWDATHDAAAQAKSDARLLYGGDSLSLADAFAGLLPGRIPQAPARAQELATGAKAGAQTVDDLLGAGVRAMPEGAGIFGGRLAKTADHAALTKAEQLDTAGTPREQIWKDTGWFKGVDGKWRFEIDDSTSRFNEVNRPTGDYLTHPGGMFKAYREVPGLGRDLGDIDLVRSGLPNTGAYLRAESHVPVTENILIGRDSPDPRSIALHEYQHAIQARENFARGWNPADAAMPTIEGINKRLSQLASEMDAYRVPGSDKFRDPRGAALKEEYDRLLSERSGVNGMDAYHRAAGEVEARNVMSRMDMTPEQRRATPPWETQDVPDAQQILRERYDGSGPQMSTGSMGGKLTKPGEAAPQLDMPRQAALKIGDQIFTGANHAISQDAAERALGKSAVDAMWNQKTGFGDQEGFVTKNGRFVTRVQANDMLNAYDREFGMNAIGELHSAHLRDIQRKHPELFAPAQTDPPGIRAYHGSPHDFDKFDLSKIGTGEGAQAYGHGLYFAENEGVAKAYRDKLGGRPDVLVGGEPITQARAAARSNDADQTVAARLATYNYAKRATGQGSPSMVDAIADTRANIERAMDIAKEKGNFDLWAKVNDQKLALQRFEERGLEFGKDPGRMYEVNLRAHPDQFLDWDKPLSGQSEKVRQAYEAALTKRGGPTIEKIGDSSFGSSGSGLQNLLSAWTKHDDPGVSGALREAGIPGIRYLDQGSRGKGEGTYNYSVFDPSIITILKKWGLLPAGLMAGGAGAARPLTTSDILDQYSKQDSYD